MPRSIGSGASVSNLYLQDDGPSFAIPTSWQDTTANTSVDNAIALARAAVNTHVLSVNASTGQVQGLIKDESAMFIDALARLDHRAGVTDYRDVVTDSIQATVNTFDITQAGGLSILVEWGLAAARAHRTYNDSQNLNAAISLWGMVNPYFVTPEDAAAGSHPLRNTSISPLCDGSTTAGAVVSNAALPNNVDVNTETTGGFSTLSAQLFEITSDARYRTAAELSAEFLRNFMYNGIIIGDSFNLQSCTRLSPDLTITYNSGKMLEAMSIIASSNTSWIPFLDGLVASTVPFSGWVDPDGVIFENTVKGSDDSFAGPRKVYFVRGLYDIWERTTDTAMADYIQAFLTVQFNALRNRALSPGTSIYSSAWTGPPPSGPPTPQGQLAAIDVLSSQIGFARARDAATSTTNNPTQTPTITPTPSPVAHTNNTKVIVGSVCGALGVIVLILLVVWYLRRRRRLARPSSGGLVDIEPSRFVSQPFSIAQASVTKPSLKRQPPSSSGSSGADAGDNSSRWRSGVLSSSPLHTVGSVRGSLDVVGRSNRVIDDRERHESEYEDPPAPPPAPNIVELLQAIVARLPPEETHGAPPSYYTGS